MSHDYTLLDNAFAASDLPIRDDRVDWAAASDAFRKLVAQEKGVVQHPCT